VLGAIGPLTRETLASLATSVRADLRPSRLAVWCVMRFGLVPSL